MESSPSFRETAARGCLIPIGGFSASVGSFFPGETRHALPPCVLSLMKDGIIRLSGARRFCCRSNTTLGRVHELFDPQEIADLIQGWDETQPSKKTDPRSYLANIGAGSHGGQAFRGGSAPGSDGSRVCRSRPLFDSHLSVADRGMGAAQTLLSLM